MRKAYLLALIGVLITVSISFSQPLSIACLINGQLGDKSFFDSAANGLETIKEKFNAHTKIVEMAYNPAVWEPSLDDISNSGAYDIIIVGTWPMVDPLTRIAAFYPENRYVIYDAKVDFSEGTHKNIHAISYKQNEGSFLAGALSALVSNSKNLKYSRNSNTIGVIGGVDSPIVNDFIVGYIQGARFINRDIKVLVSYAGVWNDPAKGKELANVMYKNGADVIFNVAANTGNGIYPAAVENDAWAIGVDSDAQLLFEKTQPEFVEHIITSMLKDIGKSLVLSVEAFEKGELEFGTNVPMGIKEGVVGLAYNQYFMDFLNDNPEIKERLSEIEKNLVDGKIICDTAIGKSYDYVYDIINPAN